ncbi:uncharacterized protein DUF1292 [Anaeroplasma bactoclasticum]|jgi:uncharacterized protein YrzB (UPF0473 family)|uniref:Uncharacterized protein DUF1292 n=1 Tax=Anaeroplasma bactoclasticum TaxID=2088 RepID=A0A397RZQ1_9MOLU|nr:DUF1292 domain-containing protein [Anaeroplasma bactoclasticum]RIA75831.1 uncharacterized protein DUF1292 [Anaeroplasma bactoclasticum]
MSKEDIITFKGENGKEMSFELIAELSYLDYDYVILRPLKKYDDLDEDQAIVFRVESDGKTNSYVIEENDEIIDAIDEIYNSEL